MLVKKRSNIVVIVVLEVALHIGDRNDATRFIVTANLEKVFSPLFSGGSFHIKL